MNRFIDSKFVVVAAILASASFAARASANLTDTYVQVDLEKPFEQFGFGLAITAQPEIEGDVLESHLTVTFETGQDFDAADFLITVTAPTDDGAGGFGNVWDVTGTSLGWAGQGTFSASISSGVLTGMIFPIPENALWEVVLGPNVGTLTELTIEHDYKPIPAPAGAALLLLGAVVGQRRRRR